MSGYFDMDLIQITEEIESPGLLSHSLALIPEIYIQMLKWQSISQYVSYIDLSCSFSWFNSSRLCLYSSYGSFPIDSSDTSKISWSAKLSSPTGVKKVPKCRLNISITLYNDKHYAEGRTEHSWWRHRVQSSTKYLQRWTIRSPPLYSTPCFLLSESSQGF